MKADRFYDKRILARNDERRRSIIDFHDFATPLFKNNTSIVKKLTIN